MAAGEAQLFCILWVNSFVRAWYSYSLRKWIGAMFQSAGLFYQKLDTQIRRWKNIKRFRNKQLYSFLSWHYFSKMTIFEKHRGGVPKSTLLPEHTLLTENRKHSRINPSTAYLSPLPNENHAAMLPYNQEAAPLNCLLFLARSHKLVKVQKSGLLPLQSDLDVWFWFQDC